MLGSGSASAGEPLDRWIRFDDPYRCVPAEVLGVLVTRLVRFEERGETYAPVVMPQTVPDVLKAHVGEPRLDVDGEDYRVTAPLAGSWQGLPLRAVEISGRVESEQGFALLFDAPREQVLAAANRAGFQLPQSGERYLDEDVLGLSIGVAARENGAVELYCMPG